MESSIFDDVTKALATAPTRREALRQIGGILGGAALAGLFPGLALADFKTCPSFCTATFGAGTTAAKQCITDASHHTGLCYSCGPASPGGSKTICCPKNANGTCTSYSSATCCTSGQQCVGGTCVTPTTTTTAPPTTTTTTTTAAPPMCSSGGDGCNPGATCAPPVGQAACLCFTDINGSFVCAHGPTFCQSCASDADCGAGGVCVPAVCCGEKTACVTRC